MASEKLIALFCVFVFSVSSFGYTFNDIPVEYWAGSGSNEAVVVIDFGADSYAFGYRWDSGTKNGKDLMDAVDLAGAMNYTQAAGFLNTISYGGYSNIGEGGWSADWWAYFTSTDGLNWTFSWDTAFSDRVLSNGSWDSWAHQTTEDYLPPAHSPTTPVPEPVTITLLGIGGLLLVKFRRV